jgi:hypothetical protein
MRDVAKHLAERCSYEPDHWMHWVFALRENDQINEAKEIALRGLERHPDEAILHFNLTCFQSLRGKFDEASQHLNRSIKLDKRFQEQSVETRIWRGCWIGLGRQAASEVVSG